MTIASERTRAVIYTEQFLVDLLDPKMTPRVPRDIRRRAAALLRHYPSQLDMEITVQDGSSRFGDQQNPFGSKNQVKISKEHDHA